MSNTQNSNNDYSAEQGIASDQLDQLRKRPDRTANISVHAGRHPWVRYNPDIGMYEIAEVSGIGNIEVEACDKDGLINLFAENPVDIKPLTKALYSPPEPGTAHVWKAVDIHADEVNYVNPQESESE